MIVGPPALDRIWLAGPAGAGKTTLARAISSRLGLPHHQLDAEFWGPGWTRTDEAGFKERVASLAAQDRWVIDGQYEAAHPALISRAQVVLWLDRPLRITLPRLILRSLREMSAKQDLHGGNRQTLGAALSLLVWASRVDDEVRRENGKLMDRFPNVRIIRLGRDVDVDQVLDVLTARGPARPDLTGGWINE